jgi:hypothetical protein
VAAAGYCLFEIGFSENFVRFCSLTFRAGDAFGTIATQHFNNPALDGQQLKLLEIQRHLPFCGRLSHRVHLQNLTAFKHR